MRKCSLLLVLVLVFSQNVSGRPHREPKQLITTLSNLISSFLEVSNGVVTSVLSAQREMVENFLRRTDLELTAASGFVSDVLGSTQQAAEAIDYIRDDFVLNSESSREARKKKVAIPVPTLPKVPVSLNNIFLNGFKTVSGIADDKLKMLIQMSSNTGKLVADTTKQISKVLKATAKFTKKVEKQKDKFEDKVTKEKLKLIETTKKSLSKFLKELSKISKHATYSKDNPKARYLLQAENELIDVTRQSFNDILEETARGIARAEQHKTKGKKPKHNKKKPKKPSTSVQQSDSKGNLISRMLSSASEKIKVFAKLTKRISHAIQKASKQKRKDIKKAQKKIQKEIKKAQKAKKKIKKKTKHDIKKILKDDPAASDEGPTVGNDSTSIPTSFNSTLENATLEGDLISNENGTALASTTVKPSVTTPTVEEEKEEGEEEEVEEDDEDAGNEDEEGDTDEDAEPDDDEEDDNDDNEDDDEDQDDEEQDDEGEDRESEDYEIDE